MVYAGRLWGIALLITSALLMQSSFNMEQINVVPHTLPTLAHSSCNRGTFRIVLDVGHTAEEPGAISARGVPEFAFNLRLAQYIGQQLISAGFAQTEVLIAVGASFSGLLQRVKRVNRIAPSLFLSIHHDSVPEAFLETWEYAGVQQHFSDRFKGHAPFISSENSHFQASLYFARLLGDELRARGLQYTSHYTQPFMGSATRRALSRNGGDIDGDQPPRRLLVAEAWFLAAKMLKSPLRTWYSRGNSSMRVI